MEYLYNSNLTIDPIFFASEMVTKIRKGEKEKSKRLEPAHFAGKTMNKKL